MLPVMARPNPHPDDEPQFTAGGWRVNAKVRVAEVAARQFGRIRCDQLRAAGVSDTTARRWCDSGYLHRVLPRVYAVGHPGGSIDADHSAALLYAGPGAALGAGTALWWRGLLKYPPDRIFVATPRRVGDLGEILVRRERRRERRWHRGLPTTTISQALVDFAATAPPRNLLRFALASADYHDLLDLDAINALTGRGFAGSAAINEALEIHLPQLAHTRSELEIVLLEVCQRYGLPMPETDVLIDGYLVDALWPQRCVVVEVDGWQGHRTRAQLERDHQRDLVLRSAGYVVLRYTWRQLTETPAAVAEDLRRYL